MNGRDHVGRRHLPHPSYPPDMVHCPECDGEIAEEEDVEFVDVVACENCGAAIGSGVAGGGG